MAHTPWEIPEKVRRNAALMGVAGHAWLADLPLRIAELERRWAIRIGRPMSRGSAAFVAQARTDDGLDVVVKIALPGIDPARQELRILQRANGVGYARLIRYDEASNAMLLEKLGRQLHELHLPEDRRIRIICATLREAWMSPPEGPPLATGADKAMELARIIESLRHVFGGACSERTIELALAYAERRRRSFDPASSVLAHGDAHEWNTLEAPGSTTGFKFVDPDGAFAEPAFDLGIPMREWGDVIPGGDLVQLGRRRCRLLSRCTGVEFQPIWEWGLLQCVSNGLLLRRIWLDVPASVEFAMAEAWAAGEDAA
jgi:streptomycin 6-kinase